VARETGEIALDYYH